MTDTQHTPGPWTACSFENLTVNAGPEGRFDEQSTIVLMAGGRPEREITSGTQLQEMQANARLIAAAPCLLDALRGLLGFEPPLLSAKERKAYAIARAAIAKATGQ
jgi:hypothetical protein